MKTRSAKVWRLGFWLLVQVLVLLNVAAKGRGVADSEDSFPVAAVGHLNGSDVLGIPLQDGKGDPWLRKRRKHGRRKHGGKNTGVGATANAEEPYTVFTPLLTSFPFPYNQGAYITASGNRCVQVVNGGTADGDQLTLGPCSTDKSAVWMAEDQTITISGALPSKLYYIDLVNKEKEEQQNPTVELFTDRSGVTKLRAVIHQVSANAVWRFSRFDAGNQYRLCDPVNSDSCIGFPGGTAAMVRWTSNDVFTFTIKYGPTLGKFQSTANGNCLATNTDGSLTLKPYDSAKFIQLRRVSYLKETKSGKCAHVYGGSEVGTKVTLWHCLYQPNFAWVLVHGDQFNQSKVNIANPASSGRCMDAGGERPNLSMGYCAYGQTTQSFVVAPAQ